jgi:hypothetical protein
LDPGADADLRLLTAIVLKNSCEKLWTKTLGAGAPGVREEKAVIKTRLLSWFNEPNKLVCSLPLIIMLLSVIGRMNIIRSNIVISSIGYYSR